MNISQIMDHIHKIEQSVPVHEWSYRGIDLWPVMRSKLYFELFNQHNFPASEYIISKKTESVKIAGRLLPSLTRSLFHIFRTCKADALFLADPSYVRLNGRDYQRFVDPEIEILSKSGKTSITLTATSVSPNAPTHPTLNIFFANLIIKALAKICGTIMKDSIHLPGFDRYNKYLQKLNLNIISSKKLRSITMQYWLSSKVYQIILKKISPQFAYVVSYYEGLNMSFVHACRKLEIPVTDIQHGAINDFHACYGGWPEMPQSGYNTLPNFFSCWDRQSADCINRWAHNTNGKHIAIVHGNKFMKKILAEDNNFTPIFSDIQKTVSPRYNVLLTIQTDYEITPFLKEMLSLSPHNYFWWIRLHPMLEEAKKQRIIKSLYEFSELRYEVSAATSLPLYAVLPHMDAHATLNSSVVIEAAQMGIPSIVCEETGHNYYQGAFERGEAYKATTAKEAINLISTASKKGKLETSDFGSLIDSIGRR